MDAGYLSHQVSGIIEQLHGLFDDIGVAPHDREARETELFAALSETLNNHVRQVNAEKKSLIDEAQDTITAIRQMEASLDDSQSHHHKIDDESLRVTYPLMRCLQALHEKHQQVHRLYMERFAQVKKLADALESYSSHLEPTFLCVTLPPSESDGAIPPSFDLSPAYVEKLDQEFARVYEEYTRRLQIVQTLAQQIVSLWSELDTPQNQTDAAILQFYRDAPEQLGLHQEDIQRLQIKHDQLANEKAAREKHLAELLAAVENMWSMLNVDENDRKEFLNANRGCGMRQINEFEDEMSRLTELKRQNLHLFVEDIRCKIQELWDAMYFSDDEMLEFTPAFSEVYSDALLEAHERELHRLQRLHELRAPLLSLISKYKDLCAQREELNQISQDASRLMMRGQKGERRDPGKLLREEKMRKRVAKDLPRVIVDLHKALESHEAEFGIPFFVYGERYIDVIDREEAASAPAGRKGSGGSSRPKPSGTTMTSTNTTPATTKPRQLSKVTSTGSIKVKSNPNLHTTATTSSASAVPSRSMAKTPNQEVKPRPLPARPVSTTSAPSANAKHGTRSPVRLQSARVPVTDNNQSNSPKRAPPPPTTDITASTVPVAGPIPDSRPGFGSLRHTGASIMRAPPPKMRDLPKLEPPRNPYKDSGLDLTQSEGPVTSPMEMEIEDVFGPDLSNAMPPPPRPRTNYNMSHVANGSSSSIASSRADSIFGVRHVSNTSSQASESENWQTYDDDNSEPEVDASDVYYAKLRATHGLHAAEQAARANGVDLNTLYAHDSRPLMHLQHGSHRSNTSNEGKWSRDVPLAQAAKSVVCDREGNLTISGGQWSSHSGYNR
ncbi:hypothetical protein TD95_005240 [Thielaviopsis punctulata]|uniref:Anaphase spindle elongation protein 1 n=1 Tax=Thielaviopsis punctulata TaxID=72032 RepID=A0A0F4ZKP9_9PEZI|nr:hypothetical protein TD95_005240 [Thielaviopsis punctulata]